MTRCCRMLSHHVCGGRGREPHRFYCLDSTRRACRGLYKQGHDICVCQSEHGQQSLYEPHKERGGLDIPPGRRENCMRTVLHESLFAAPWVAHTSTRIQSACRIDLQASGFCLAVVFSSSCSKRRAT